MDQIKDFYRDLFQYTNYYNQDLATLIFDNRSRVTEKTISLLNHILNAHEIWNCRIKNVEPQIPVWGQRPLTILKSIDNENFHCTMSIIEIHGFQDVIVYKTSKGDLYNNKVSDLLYHIVNHSTYHRAQIASELKQQGIAPPITDYVVYKR